MKPKLRHKQTISLKIGNLGTTVCPSKEKVAAHTFLASDQQLLRSGLSFTNQQIDSSHIYVPLIIPYHQPISTCYWFYFLAGLRPIPLTFF